MDKRNHSIKNVFKLAKACFDQVTTGNGWLQLVTAGYGWLRLVRLVTASYGWLRLVTVGNGCNG